MNNQLANKTDSFCERIYLRILDGYLVPGGRLPSEQALSDSLNLSRTTIRAGLARLISGGIIERRGKRTFIHEDAVRRIETLERGPRRLIIAEVASNICNPLIETMFTKLHNELGNEYSMEVWLLSGGDDVRLETVTKQDKVIFFGTPPGFISKIKELAGFILLVGWVEPGFSYIVPNNYAAGVKVATYLLRNGHRRVAGLFGRSLSDDGFRARHDGVRDILKKRGGKLIDFDGFDNDELSNGAVCDRLERFISENSITAAVAAYDEIALSFHGELLRRGHRLPEYLSLIGFDDRTPSRYVNPSLTTARMPLNMMVQNISALLHDMPSADTTVEREIDFTLMMRESVADISGSK